jgi:hypothetical protein
MNNMALMCRECYQAIRSRGEKLIVLDQYRDYDEDEVEACGMCGESTADGLPHEDLWDVAFVSAFTDTFFANQKGGE